MRRLLLRRPVGWRVVVAAPTNLMRTVREILKAVHDSGAAGGSRKAVWRAPLRLQRDGWRSRTASPIATRAGAKLASGSNCSTCAPRATIAL